MIALVYSGSKFANWKLYEKGKEVIDVRTNGINPFFNDEKYIINLLNKQTTLIYHAEEIKKIYFYGPGASSPERIGIVNKSLSLFFKNSRIVQVAHDIDAAAIATCDDKPGIVNIIGSGSNTGFFDGKRVLENNYGLGYAIGDEGSANWLGKQLLKQYLNQTMPEHIRTLFEKKYELDRRIILDKIYKQPHPNVFLHSFVEFLTEHRNDTFVKDLVMEGFRLFMDIYLIPNSKRYGGKHPIYFVGTVSANFQDYLREVATEKNIIISTVIKEPIYNLLNYYANKN